MNDFSVRPSPLDLSSPGSYLQHKQIQRVVEKEATNPTEDETIYVIHKQEEFMELYLGSLLSFGGF